MLMSGCQCILGECIQHLHSPGLQAQLRSTVTVREAAEAYSDEVTYEVPQLQLEEPQLFLFLGGSPHAQLGYEQSFDSV